MHPGFPPTLILPVPSTRWPPPVAPITVDGVTLAPKPELHITLIGNRLARELELALGPTRASAVVASAFATGDWGFARTGRRLLLRKPLPPDGTPDFAFSFIELVELPAMAPLHAALGRHLGRQLPVPPPHVTLYTAGCDSGIGVTSPGRLRAFTVQPR